MSGCDNSDISHQQTSTDANTQLRFTSGGFERERERERDGCVYTLHRVVHASICSTQRLYTVQVVDRYRHVYKRQFIECHGHPCCENQRKNDDNLHDFIRVHSLRVVQRAT